MLAMSPKLVETLVKATYARSVEDPFDRVFSEFLDLKLNHLEQLIGEFRSKWGYSFEELKVRMQKGSIDIDPYSFEAENDFWQWEEAETLKEHYTSIKNQWM